jgi:DNA-binding transcriptional regulator GbsR (MarR family)
VPSGFLWISFCANFVFPQISQISRRFSQSTFGLIIHVTLLPQAARKNPRHPRHPRSLSKSASPASSAFPIQIRVTRIIRVPHPNPRHPRHPRSPSKSASPASSAFPIQIRVTRVIRVLRVPKKPRSTNKMPEFAFHVHPIPLSFKIMDLQEGKRKFIESWGKMAGGWGISPAMAQVHALLLVSPEPISADQVKSELDISTGNVSMNLRSLLDWGLIYKEASPNCRKELYYAEKDLWTVIRQIIINRKKRELEPVLQVLDELAAVQDNCPQSQHFCNVVNDIRKFTHKANSTLDTLIKAESHWLGGAFLNMVR